MPNSAFLLTSHIATYPPRLSLRSKAACYYLFTDQPVLKVLDGIQILIDGYILPINNVIYGLSGKLSQHELVFELFQKHGIKFIDYVKGFFCLVLIHKDQVYIFNDQLGLNKFFYYLSEGSIVISNSYKALYQQKKEKNINSTMIGLKALLNREINGQTIIDGIMFSQPATRISIKNGNVNIDKYWDYRTVRDRPKISDTYQFFAELLKNIIQRFHHSFKPKAVSITLTGGKDSRTALCALLASNIKPLGITYGAPASKDAVYAGIIAKSAGIEHVVISPEKTIQWFEQAAIEIINLDNPLINIHRSHRLSAFKHLNQLLGEDTAYYGGYLGSELLMGPYYDDLIFTRVLTDAWETLTIEENFFRILHSKFVNPPNSFHGLIDQLSTMQTVNVHTSKKEMQFHGLFEIGILHHSQDLMIARNFLKYPIAFFLDLDFICQILSSVYSFENQKNTKTINLLKRYGFYEFNLNLQHILYPALDHVPFAKNGFYNTQEFLKGPYYWSLIKTLRHLLYRKRYPPSFSYNEAYRQFILKYLALIRDEQNCWVHDHYDVHSAFAFLEKQPLFMQEKDWHPFSNIVMHYLQIKWFDNAL